MNKLAHQMGCACTVYRFPKDKGKYRLVYCPMHEAAPTLEACLQAIANWHVDEKTDHVQAVALMIAMARLTLNINTEDKG